MTGQVFGRVTVLSREGERAHCRCECGTLFSPLAYNLSKGFTTSCGCYRAQRGVTHGQSKSPEFVTWQAVKSRCLNPRARNFERYGGRGITVCPQWVDSFEIFLKDMGPRPSPDHSIDRIDNDGPYSPENCRWATRREQLNNQSGNRLVTWEGKTQTIAEWATEVGLKYDTLYYRLEVYGWETGLALTAPLHFKPKR